MGLSLLSLLLVCLLSPLLAEMERPKGDTTRRRVQGSLHVRGQGQDQEATAVDGKTAALTFRDIVHREFRSRGSETPARYHRISKVYYHPTIHEQVNTGFLKNHRANTKKSYRTRNKSNKDRRTNQLPLFYRKQSEAKGWVRACYLAINLPIEKLDPYLCTHLLSFFGSLTDDGELQIVSENRPKIAALTRMRDSRNPGLRVLVSTGGSNDKFALIASNRTTRIRFSKSVVRLMEELRLDGVDLDWEFPAFMRPVEERRDFTKLLEVLNSQLKRMTPPRLLTVAVGAPPSIVLASYDVPGISAAVDFVSIMAYDYHLYQAILPATGHNSPLFAAAQDAAFLGDLNGNYSIHLWLQLGLPPEKLLFGIATYGLSWKLRDPADHGLYSPSTGIYGSGDVTIADVCLLLAGNATRVWDPFSLVPYMYGGYEWISYDDSQSVAAKAMLVRAMNVAGAMTFILDSDDWGGLCGLGEFPLHNVIRDILPSMEKHRSSAD